MALRVQWVRAKYLESGDCWLRDADAAIVPPLTVAAGEGGKVRVTWPPFDERSSMELDPYTAVRVLRPG